MKSSGDGERATETPPVRRPGGRTLDVSNRIASVVLESLVKDGYGALNFQDIAERAEVSRTTLYRRWPTKAELVLDVMTSELEKRFHRPDTGSFVGDLTAGLRQVGAALASPFGVAALAASVEMARANESGEARQELWIRRVVDLIPLVERAKARQELKEDFDIEAVLAALVGAMYYRVLIMARPVDERWIKRIIAVVMPARTLSQSAPHGPLTRAPKRKK